MTTPHRTLPLFMSRLFALALAISLLAYGPRLAWAAPADDIDVAAVDDPGVKGKLQQLISNFYQENPVTKEKQFVKMTVEDEIKFGKQMAPEIAKKLGGFADASSVADKTVKRIGRLLVDATHAKTSPYVFEFHLCEDAKLINAFALPGGQIFVTRALYDQLENEAQLAAVVGHEIGHVINRHSNQRIARGEIGVKVVRGVLGVAVKKDETKTAVAQAVTGIVLLKNSRDHEKQSDSFGLEYVVEAGYNPEAAQHVWGVFMKMAGQKRPPEMLSTHPDPGNRMEATRQFIAAKFPNGIPQTLKLGAALPRDPATRPATRPATP